MWKMKVLPPSLTSQLEAPAGAMLSLLSRRTRPSNTRLITPTDCEAPARGGSRAGSSLMPSRLQRRAVRAGAAVGAGGGGGVGAAVGGTEVGGAEVAGADVAGWARVGA